MLVCSSRMAGHAEDSLGMRGTDNQILGLKKYGSVNPEDDAIK